MQSQIKLLQDTVQDLETLNKHLESEINVLQASSKLQVETQLVDLKMKDAKVESLIAEIKAIEAETTRREEEKNKDFEMLKTNLVQEQAKVAQKQLDLSNLIKSSVEGRRSMTEKHVSEVALLNKKTKFVTCITMKVRDLLYTKMTKL